jgi:hypothetical protein
MVQNLTMCKTIDAGKLHEAAMIKKDENILIHIRDKDCVAIEVCYHSTCYKNYTCLLSKSVADDATDSAHNTAYKAFGEEVIDAKICKNQEIFFMKNLVDIFLEYIVKYEGNQDGSGYRASKLKNGLVKSHPQLVFHAYTQRNTSEIVFAEDFSAGTLARQLFSGEDNSSVAEGEAEETVPARHTQESESTELFRAAMILKNIIKDVPALQCQWPPTADNFNEEAVLQAVPPELFNFLCWSLVSQMGHLQSH